MHIFLEVIRGTARVIISMLQLAMFARAILSWFPMEEGKISSFLHALTEPVILPVRALFHKMGWGENLPIDIPFFVTFIILSIVSGLL